MIYKPKYVYKWDLYTPEEKNEIYKIEIEYNSEIDIVIIDDKITEEGIEIIDNYVQPLIMEIGEYYYYYNLKVCHDLYKRLHKNLTKKAISYEEFYKEAIIREIIE